jgi:ubiquinone/menaquinone biosynthesis C-methylase UbiE
MSDPQTDQDFLKSAAYAQAEPLDTRNRLQDEYGTNPRNWFSWLYERLQLPEAARLLDLGCGPADLWLAGPQQLPAGWQVLLSDLSEGMLEEARRRLGERRVRFACLTCDAQAIPAPDGAFTAVLAHGLLDHVPDRGQALHEIQRVLEPGGLLYASTGSRSHLQEIGGLVQPFLPRADFGGAAERFGLENGARLLAPWFEPVELQRYTSELVFDSPGPVLEYILSEPAVRRELGGERRAALEDRVKALLQEQGSLRVNVDKVLFTAYRRPRS